MNRLLLKVVAAIVGTIVAGAIAVFSLLFLAEYQFFDLVGVMIALVAGAIAAFSVFEKLGQKT